MSYDLDRLHLNPKEREKILMKTLKCFRFNDGKNTLIHKIYRRKRKRLSLEMSDTYGDRILNGIIDFLRDNGYIKASEDNRYFKITPRGKIALKRGFVETEPEKPYEKYMAWCGVAAIPIGLFSSEIRTAAKWLWQALSDFLCRIF